MLAAEYGFLDRTSRASRRGARERRRWLNIDFVTRFEYMAVQIVEGKTGAGSVFDALTFYFASL